MSKTNVDWMAVNTHKSSTPVSKVEKLDLTPGLWTSGKTYWNHGRMEFVLMEEEISMKISVEHPHSKINMVNYFVYNHSKTEKHVKLLALHYCQSVLKDHFSFISPADDIVFHLAGKQLYLVDGRSSSNEKWETTVIPSWHSSLDGIWGCKQKGTLKYTPMAKGNPASVLSREAAIPPGKIIRATTWCISGKNKNELLSLNTALLKNRLAFPKE
ncbi:hypothetical protein D1B31_08915 [Neobacillus notoginsengisoli]|uniref:Uncharacterized protein n=1 Tax=Neobacillus notoginsengisoli TaxID=1578198 RepID=A0A417YV06_9BACI|nr:hypothetical protein [Neobacillus notoginsengisoli]RHW41058.1 hypothetical protein D1B31_08915 [Neobacillus notoginsengisoli]